MKLNGLGEVDRVVDEGTVPISLPASPSTNTRERERGEEREEGERQIDRYIHTHTHTHTHRGRDTHMLYMLFVSCTECVGVD